MFLPSSFRRTSGSAAWATLMAMTCLLVVVFHGQTIEAIMSDVFQVKLVATIPSNSAPSYATFITDIDSAINTTFADSAKVVRSVSITGNLLTVQAVVATVSAQPTAHHSMWQVFEALNSNPQITTLWSAMQLSASARLSVTLGLSSSVVQMPCQSTVSGYCRDGTSSELKIKTTLAPALSDSQLVSTFCHALGFSGSSLSSCPDVGLVSRTSTTVNAESGVTAVLAIRGRSDTIAPLLRAIQDARTKGYVFSSIQLEDLAMEGPSGEFLSLYTSADLTLAEASAPVDTYRECELEDYWFMLLLICILPVEFLLFLAVYRQGKRNGKSKESKKMQEEQDRMEQFNAILQQQQQQGQQTQAQSAGSSAVAVPQQPAQQIAAP